MSNFTYEEKQILALRHAVQMIAAVLNDTQKNQIDAMLNSPKETMKGVIPDEKIDDAYEIIQMSREIMHL